MKRISDNISTGLIAIATLLSVALLWEYNLILFIVLTTLTALMLLIKKSKQEMITFALCAFFGAIAESVAVLFGAWNYGNPNLLNIPIWLIVLWGIASIFIVRTYLLFEN